MLGVGTLAQTYLAGVPFGGSQVVTQTKGYARSSDAAANGARSADAAANGSKASDS